MRKIDGATAIAETVATGREIGCEPRLADLHVQVGDLLDRCAPQALDQQRVAARERYREFFRRHEDAFFQDAELTASIRPTTWSRSARRAWPR